MARKFKDLIVNEADGKVRYNLVKRDGSIIANDVRVEVASEVLQEGDSFGALAANRTLQLDNDGTPLLIIDNGENKKDGSIKHYRGTSVPSSLPYGEVFVLSNGTLYVGGSNNKPIKTNATADSVAWANVSGKPSTFAPSTHNHAAANITSGTLPLARGGTGRADGVHWNNVQAKPSTFAPSSHNHTWASVTGKPSTFTPAAHIHKPQDIDGITPTSKGGTGRTDGISYGFINHYPYSTSPIKVHMFSFVTSTNELGDATVLKDRNINHVENVLVTNGDASTLETSVRITTSLSTSFGQNIWLANIAYSDGRPVKNKTVRLQCTLFATS